MSSPLDVVIVPLDTPILTVTYSDGEPSGAFIFRLSILVLIFSATFIEPYISVSYKNTINSSPPKRQAMSVSHLNEADMASDIFTRQLSPL